MTDKRAEAVKLAESIKAHCAVTHDHPDLIMLACELLALHAENEKLTADNADLVAAAAHARGLLADDYFENWEQAHDVLHDVITRPHPGHALLQRVETREAELLEHIQILELQSCRAKHRIEKLEAVVEAAKDIAGASSYPAFQDCRERLLYAIEALDAKAENTR